MFCQWKGTLEDTLLCFAQWNDRGHLCRLVEHLIRHFTTFCPLERHFGGALSFFVHWKGTLKGILSCFVYLKDTLEGILSVFFPMEGYSHGHFIMFCLLERHWKALNHILSIITEGTSSFFFINLRGKQEGD